jgi:hypothetical protein
VIWTAVVTMECKSFFLKETLDEAISRAVKNKKKPA